uniref:Uncharacterized protein n=1 Tax=Anguilla anguilla TaxID=7936 RepID=A0A0E9THN9_ANGAN
MNCMLGDSATTSPSYCPIDFVLHPGVCVCFSSECFDS